jgi:hypothetical protein
MDNQLPKRFSICLEPAGEARLQAYYRDIKTSGGDLKTRALKVPELFILHFLKSVISEPEKYPNPIYPEVGHWEVGTTEDVVYFNLMHTWDQLFFHFLQIWGTDSPQGIEGILYPMTSFDHNKFSDYIIQCSLDGLTRFSIQVSR